MVYDIGLMPVNMYWVLRIILAFTLDNLLRKISKISFNFR